MCEVETKGVRHLAQRLSTGGLRHRTHTERIQCNHVSAFLELYDRVPLKVLGGLVLEDELLALALLAVARLDEVPHLQRVEVQLNANDTLS